MSVEAIGRDLSRVVALTEEGQIIAEGGSVQRTAFLARIGVLRHTINTAQAETEGIAADTEHEQLLIPGMERFDEALAAFRAMQIDGGDKPSPLAVETAMTVHGALSNAKGFRDHRNPAATGLCRAVEASRTLRSNMGQITEHLAAIHGLLDDCATLGDRMNSSVQDSIQYGERGITAIHTYAQAIEVPLDTGIRYAA